MSCVPVISSFTHVGTSTTSWEHLAEFDATIYVLFMKNLTGNPATAITFNGIPMTRIAWGDSAGSNENGSVIYSLTNPPVGTGTIVVTGATTAVHGVSFNVVNGPRDGSVGFFQVAHGSYADVDLYGAGFDEDDLVVAFTFQNGPYLMTVTDGTELFSGTSFAGAYKQAVGGPTKISFHDAGLGDFEQGHVIFTIPNHCQVVHAGLIQPWLMRHTTGTSNQQWPLPHGQKSDGITLDANGNGLLAGGVTPVGITVRNFQIDLDDAPGLGNGFTFTVLRNGARTRLTVTIQGVKTSAFISRRIDVLGYKFSKWGLYCEPIGSPSNMGFSMSLECETSVKGVSIYGGGQRDAAAPDTVGGTGRKNPFFPRKGSTWSNDATEAGRVGPPGWIVGALFQYNHALGAAAYDAYLYKSTNDGTTYVKQDGTGGTPNTLIRLEGPSTAGESLHFGEVECAFALGDQTFWGIEATDGVVGNPGLGGSMIVTTLFKSRTGSEFILDGHSTGLNVDPTDIYEINENDNQGGTTTESDRVITIGPFTKRIAVLGITWAVTTGPGSGQKRVASVRKNESNALSSIITGTSSPSRADIAGLVTFQQHNRISMGFEEIGAPAGSGVAFWALRGRMQRIGVIGPLAWVHWPRRIP